MTNNNSNTGVSLSSFSPSFFAGRSWSEWKENVDLNINGNVRKAKPDVAPMQIFTSLPRTEMALLGQCPSFDSSWFVVCEVCGQIIKPMCLAAHLASRHADEKETTTAECFDEGARSSLSSSGGFAKPRKRKSRHTFTKGMGVASNAADEESDGRLDSGISWSVENYNYLQSDSNDSSSCGTAFSSTALTTTFDNYRPDEHCGVMNVETRTICMSSLACERHTIAMKRAVANRSLPFDALLREQQRHTSCPSSRINESTVKPSSRRWNLRPELRASRPTPVQFHSRPHEEALRSVESVTTLSPLQSPLRMLVPTSNPISESSVNQQQVSGLTSLGCSTIRWRSGLVTREAYRWLGVRNALRTVLSAKADAPRHAHQEPARTKAHLERIALEKRKRAEEAQRRLVEAQQQQQARHEVDPAGVGTVPANSRLNAAVADAFQPVPSIATAFPQAVGQMSPSKLQQVEQTKLRLHRILSQYASTPASSRSGPPPVLSEVEEAIGQKCFPRLMELVYGDVRQSTPVQMPSPRHSQSTTSHRKRKMPTSTGDTGAGEVHTIPCASEGQVCINIGQSCISIPLNVIKNAVRNALSQQSTSRGAEQGSTPPQVLIKAKRENGETFAVVATPPPGTRACDEFTTINLRVLPQVEAAVKRPIKASPTRMSPAVRMPVSTLQPVRYLTGQKPLRPAAIQHHRTMKDDDGH